MKQDIRQAWRQFLLLNFSLLIMLGLWPGSSQTALAHGGVAFAEDQCVINIDFLTAHFTIYQPEASGSKEFCEDLPAVTDTLFVMEYLHDYLREMPVDFRIIEDREDVGIYARWEDIAGIADLDEVTVFYQPPEIRPSGELTVNYRFEEKGTYIGIVTAQHPQDDRVYRSVFYFQTGGPDYGSLPLFLALILVLQGGYWLGNGGWRRLRS
ncbi:MAG: hypothetical protein RQ757_08155 [Pseudomonadales bacterium]|nr:hypothetical protein [Pseudomonadales bacterium]